MLAFGVLGYLAKKMDFPLAPAVLTLILSPLMEKALRQSLEMSRGNFGIFFTRPISAVLLSLAALLLLSFASRHLLAALRSRQAGPRLSH
jgi:putative tricarboxylic transport membrane protein